MISYNKEKDFVSDYVVFDLETTGLDSKFDKIIEIGALKYKNNKLVEEFSVLINPNIKLPSIITKITGIKDSDLKDKQTIDIVLPKFIEFIEDLTLIAHNSRFDLGFIEENIKRLNLAMITNKNIDTVYLARKYIPEVANVKLETLKEHFNLDYGSHRSVDDCKTTNYVYAYCKTKALGVKN